MVCEQPIAPESSGVEWGQAIMPACPDGEIVYFSRNRKRWWLAGLWWRCLWAEGLPLSAYQETSAHGPGHGLFSVGGNGLAVGEIPKAALRGYVHTNKFGVPVQESDNLLPGGRSPPGQSGCR